MFPGKRIFQSKVFNRVPYSLPVRERFASARMQFFLIGALAGGYVVGFIAITVFWRWESRHPVLRIKRVPKPDIALNLNLKSPENILDLR